MKRMPGSHSAENIKIATEQMVNRYKFDKSKVIAVVCDQGSSLVRLFTQILDPASKSEILPQSLFNNPPKPNEWDLIQKETEKELEKEFNLENTDAGTIDKEVTEIIKNMDEFVLEEISYNDNENYEDTDITIYDHIKRPFNQIEDSIHYDTSNNQLTINELIINLGSSDLPRFSCINHKTNLSVKGAMITHTVICSNFVLLNKWIAHIKNCTILNQIFRELLCRLKLENSTRWGSVYVLLEGILKAFKRGAFDKNIDPSLELPISITLIKEYLAAFRPAYDININFQSTVAIISDVIPSVKNAIYLWKKNMITLKFKSCIQLCELLIEEFETRFEFELNSKIYQVSVIFSN